MSKIICYEGHFFCEKCEIRSKEYVWTDRKEEPACKECGTFLCEVEKESSNDTFFITKHKNGRTPEEQKKRQSEHFKKEIYPTLDKSSKHYFGKKYGIKK